MDSQVPSSHQQVASPRIGHQWTHHLAWAVSPNPIAQLHRPAVLRLAQAQPFRPVHLHFRSSFSSHLRLLGLVPPFDFLFLSRALSSLPRFYQSASFKSLLCRLLPHPLDSDCAPFPTGARDQPITTSYLSPDSTTLRDFGRIQQQPCLGVMRGYVGAYRDGLLFLVKFLWDAETNISPPQVNAHDDEDHDDVPQRRVQVPNSPPPSFHSRASSPTTRNGRVNNDLADAFDDDDASEDETDDRARLVRQDSTPTIRSTNDSARLSAPTAPVSTQATSDSTSSSSRPRVMGGGFGSDGVFANMSARPQRTDGNAEKEEQPPVCLPCF